jgi:hypothetical protein
MGKRKTGPLTITGLWSKESRSLTAANSLDLVLGATLNLPLKYWRPHFFFTGAPDAILHTLSDGEFPATKSAAGFFHQTHPIFARDLLPGAVGFKASPCSSRKPYRKERYRHIRAGCRLRYTGHVMDRDSDIVDNIRLNIPPSVAYRLRFLGEVPKTCVEEAAVISRPKFSS